VNIKNMIIEQLRCIGADGLCGEECGCGIDDLMPCGDPHERECVAACKVGNEYRPFYEPKEEMEELHPMRISALQIRAHDIARSKGWWDEERTFLEICALIHSEVSEAVEWWRNCEHDGDIVEGKPEGTAVELADVIIRVLDYAGKRGWNMERIIDAKMRYNETREHKHGGKRA